ncbi:MAG: hemerythrin domain-containing protein [Myxococcota bacterium]
MPSPVTRLLAVEHAESQAKLDACVRSGEVDLKRFDEFRHNLLRHIAIEERVLMPALTKALGKAPLFQNGLRKDHAGIAALCVPTPTREWLEDLKELLAHHQRVEEAPGGFYALLDQHVGGDPHLLEQVARFPRLSLPDFVRGPKVRDLLEEVLSLTGITNVPPPRSSRPGRR